MSRPRNRIHAFITPAELCALLADEAPKHAAGVYCRVEEPAARLVSVSLATLGEVVEREHVRELYLALPGHGPDYDQDWHFRVRNRKSIVIIELGSTSETVEPTTCSTDADGTAMVLLRDLERVLSRLCNKYVRVPQTMRLQKLLWSPGVAGRNLLGREAVPDELAKIERARAAAKRKPKWKLREAAGPVPPTLHQEGKNWYGASIDDLRAEVLRFSRANGFAAELFFQPTCPCTATPGSSLRLVCSDEDRRVEAVCQSCGRHQPLVDGAAHPVERASMSTCDCELREEYGELLLGAALFAGSEDLRWLYVGWRAPACGLLRVLANWQCDGSRSWPEVIANWR